MLKVSLPNKSAHQFKVFYLAKDEEDVASVSAAIDVLIELEVGPYVETILEAADSNERLSTALEEAKESGSILVPVLLNKEGYPRYLGNKTRSNPVYKLIQYWWDLKVYRDFKFMRNKWGSDELTIYPGLKNLIVCGERLGSPCMQCPNVLDSIGSAPSCNFGCKDCLTSLNLKQLVENANDT